MEYSEIIVNRNKLISRSYMATDSDKIAVPEYNKYNMNLHHHENLISYTSSYLSLPIISPLHSNCLHYYSTEISNYVNK
jgi:hypothetical protein